MEKYEKRLTLGKNYHLVEKKKNAQKRYCDD